MPEIWLVHPTDRVVTVYRLEGAGYGRPTIRETFGMLEVAAVPELRIDWKRVFPLPPERNSNRQE